jgi:flagellar biosynthesis GTPase FlhF
MSSLADLPDLVGFFSYSREDDLGSRGGLSALRDAIQTELSAQLGRSQNEFRIWQDKTAISLGTLWEKEITQGIHQSAFFIPIVTPRALRSQNCGFEFQSFLAREAELGRDDLVFPILYIPVPALEDEKVWRNDPVLSVVGTRQYLDWRELRHHDPHSTEVRQRLERFCRGITTALYKSWISSDDRRRQDAEQARQRAEEEDRRKTAQIEAERVAQEEHRRRDAEAARRAQEEEGAKRAEKEAQQRAAEERRRQKAAAERRREEERAFAVATRAGTVAAIDAFLAAHPAGDFTGDADKLKVALRTREAAYTRAMASDDLVILRSFRDAYKKGIDVDQVRERLRLFAPEQSRSLKPIVVLSAVAAVLVVALAAWFAMLPGSSTQQVAAAVNPAPTTPPALPAQPKAQVSDAAPNAPSSRSVAPAPVPSAVPAENPAEIAWSLIKDTNDDDALQRFAKEFPDSPRRKEADTRIAALMAEQASWSLVRDSKDPDQLRRFIQQFPNGADRADAQQRIASLSATAPVPASAPAADPRELARALQFELQRVGCFNGTVNGQFDDDTKSAWHRFIKLTSLSLPDDVTTDAINAVRGINRRVCPLICPHGQHAEDGACVANEPPPRTAKTAPAPAAPSAPEQPKSTNYCQHTSGHGDMVTNAGVICN